MIVLSSALNVGDTVSCGIFTASVANITTIMGNTLLSSTISFTASSDLDGTEVVCTDGNQAEVESYPIMVVGEWLNQGEPSWTAINACGYTCVGVLHALFHNTITKSCYDN